MKHWFALQVWLSVALTPLGLWLIIHNKAALADWSSVAATVFVVGGIMWLFASAWTYGAILAELEKRE